MKTSKQVRSEHQSFIDAWSKINEHTNSTLAKEISEAPVVEEKKEVVEKVLVRKEGAFTAQAEKYQMVVKQFARFVESNQHLFDLPTRKKAVLANKFQGFKESKEWDEFFGDLELVEEPMVLTKADKVGNTPAWQNRNKKNPKTGENVYKKADHLKDEEVKPEGENIQEVTTKDTKSGTKFKVRVKDKATGSSYIRFATREKIAQLRSDPKISSVEMTDEGQTPEERGEAKAKAAGGGAPTVKKDKKTNASKRSVTTEGSNWRQDLKEIIGEVEIKEAKKSKKGGKVKNPVCINPDTDDDKNKYEEKKIEEHHQKDADGNVIPHEEVDAQKIAENLNAQLKGIEIEDADGNTAFEVVDLIKPEPMKGIASEEAKLPDIEKSKTLKTIQGIRKGVLPLSQTKIASKS